MRSGEKRQEMGREETRIEILPEFPLHSMIWLQIYWGMQFAKKRELILRFGLA